MPILGPAPSSPRKDASLSTWRVETAVRVFTLALAIGLAMSGRTFYAVLPLTAAITVMSAVAAGLSLNTRASWNRWSPIVEAVLVSIVLASSAQAPALLAYLAVPPIIAGVRSGIVTTVNTACAAIFTYMTTMAISPSRDLSEVSEGITWAVVGLGMGLLASWQTRAVREARARQEPHLAANELMSSLHGLTQRGEVGLDPRMIAGDLAAALRHLPGCAASAVLLETGRACPEMLASYGDTSAFATLFECRDGDLPPGVLSLPLRSGSTTVGEVLLDCEGTFTAREHAQRLADEFALRLETAGMFERVRLLATAEERNRIARDMHDGVAQEVVALGYVVDEIAALSSEPEVHELTAGLRNELTRVVTELRYSIFDLRHEMTGTNLSSALGGYVRRIVEDGHFQAHLVLDVSGDPLSPRIETHLLRVAQEAIGNVRKHARASQVWVTLRSDGAAVLLQIEDDGVGKAAPKERHWGLQSMRERAEAIGGHLSIHDRENGGTVVRLERPAPSLSRHLASEGTHHGHHSAAGR